MVVCLNFRNIAKNLTHQKQEDDMYDRLFHFQSGQYSGLVIVPPDDSQKTHSGVKQGFTGNRSKTLHN